MTPNSVWVKAQELELQIAEQIEPGFDMGFDNKIPADISNELRSFVNWIERHYRIPIALIVDFEYKHYLVSRTGQRVGYLFYWSDFSSYPKFDDDKNLPQIRLPVRTEHSTMEEILTSFIEAISDCYAWLCNEISEEYTANEQDVEEILCSYLASRG